jgi:hypothetical protein
MIPRAGSTCVRSLRTPKAVIVPVSISVPVSVAANRQKLG